MTQDVTGQGATYTLPTAIVKKMVTAAKARTVRLAGCNEFGYKGKLCENGVTRRKAKDSPKS